MWDCQRRFVGLVHVKDTNALSLKTAIEFLFVEHDLSLKKIRGQGYDGASNMRGQFNGLKALILGENSSAYYVHCFAHQLQLVVVAVAHKHIEVGKFFDMISSLMNVVCASCKRTYMIRESQKEKVQEAIGSGETETCSGLNQELSLGRPEDTRWGSHYKTLKRLVDLFPFVIEVLRYVEDACGNPLNQRQASGLQIYFNSFESVFYLHLMLHILGLTESLSQALQKKDQDILNVVSLVKSTKQQLQQFRVDGFCWLLDKIASFCEKHDIEMVSMEELYVNPKSRRHKSNITFRHYYEYECFNTIMDMQIQEFGERFDEVSSELLACMGSLNSNYSFSDFGPSKLLKLAEFYPGDFNNDERVTLEHQLPLYINNVQHDELFANLKGISKLGRVMIERRKHLLFPLVYRLLKLALVLPVATATLQQLRDAFLQ